MITQTLKILVLRVPAVPVVACWEAETFASTTLVKIMLKTGHQKKKTSSGVLAVERIAVKPN